MHMVVLHAMDIHIVGLTDWSTNGNSTIQSNLPTTGLREAVRLSTTAKLDGTESFPIPAIRLKTPRSG